MRSLIERLLASLLDRLGTKWKSPLGLAGIITAMVLYNLDVIDAEQYDFWYKMAIALFGVGIFHRASKAGRAVDAATPGP